jgi:Sulfotransferase family
MNPILVTGLIRSGTTWVGKVLASAQQGIYIHEPFNPDSPWNACFPLPNKHIYLTEINGGPYLRLFKKLLELRPIFHGQWREKIKEDRYEFINNHVKRNGPKESLVPIIKDPTAIFSVEWLVEKFGITPIILLRHPISIVKSLVRLGWAKSYTLNFIANQPLLVKKMYSDKTEEMAELTQQDLPEFLRAVWFVRYLYHAILFYKRNYPHWNYVSYEDILINSEEKIRNIMTKVSLVPSQYTLDKIGTEGKSEYDPTIAHQKTIKPIAFKSEEIFESCFDINNWEEIFDVYFSDIYSQLYDTVRWKF